MGNINEAFKKMQSQDLAELAEKNKREEEQKPLSFDEIVKRFKYTPNNNIKYMFDRGDMFIPLHHTDAVKRHARSLGLEHEEINRFLVQVEQKPIFRVFQTLAGCAYGVHRFSGEDVLVMKSAPWIEGEEGDWTTIEKFLRSRFDDPQHPEQFHIFMGWLKSARKKIREVREKGDTKTACQLLVIAGGADIGKTSIILKLLIAPLLATPKGSMYEGSKYFGKSTDEGFNGGMERYPLIVLDDVFKGAGVNQRKNIFARAKNTLYSGAVPIEGKGKDSFSMKLPWAIVQLMNTDEESLSAFPIVGADTDKLLGLLASEYHDAPPFVTDAQKEEFDKKVESELSAFAYAVDNYEVPNELRDSKNERHVCKAWIHPELEKMVHEISIEARLLDLIDEAVGNASDFDTNIIYGENVGARAIYDAVIKNLSSNKVREFEQLTGRWRCFGKKLKALSEKPDSVVKRKESGNNSTYTILRPVERDKGRD